MGFVVVLLVVVVAFVVGSMTSSVETEIQLPHLYR
jgi:biopolymer transport protein ExbD